MSVFNFYQIRIAHFIVNINIVRFSGTLTFGQRLRTLIQKTEYLLQFTVTLYKPRQSFQRYLPFTSIFSISNRCRSIRNRETSILLLTPTYEHSAKKKLFTVQTRNIRIGSTNIMIINNYHHIIDNFYNWNLKKKKFLIDF